MKLLRMRHILGLKVQPFNIHKNQIQQLRAFYEEANSLTESVLIYFGPTNDSGNICNVEDPGPRSTK
jgi:hypothetical protein